MQNLGDARGWAAAVRAWEVFAGWARGTMGPAFAKTPGACRGGCCAHREAAACLGARVPPGRLRTGSPAGAGALGWAGRGWWAGPETAALGWLWHWLGVPPPGSRVQARPGTARAPLLKQEPQAGWLTWAGLSRDGGEPGR